jgi:hypothetical protein
MVVLIGIVVLCIVTGIGTVDMLKQINKIKDVE